MVVMMTIHLYMTPKSVKLSCIFLLLDSILAEIFGGQPPLYSLAVEISHQIFVDHLWKDNSTPGMCNCIHQMEKTGYL